MRRSNLGVTTLAAILIGLLSFLCGFTYHVVAAADTAPVPFRMSEALAAPGGGAAGQGATNASVKPLEMFHQTYELVRQRYRLAKDPSWDDANLLYAGLDGLLRSLGDPYTLFLTPRAYREMLEQNQGHFHGIGAYLQATPDRRRILLAPITGGPAARAGLKRGDILLKISTPKGPVSAVGLDVEKAKNLIRGPAGTTVKLTVGRLADPSKPEGAGNPMKTVELTVERDVIRTDGLRYSIGPPNGHEGERDIGYIQLEGTFSDETEGQLDQALAEMSKKKVKGIILDLRDNPGGLLEVAIGVCSRFIPEGPVVFIQESGGARMARNAVRSKYFAQREGPMVVLVNKQSASASEIVAGALRDKGVAKLVGETTFGKGLVQTIIPLESDGSAGALKITTAKYFTPNGTDINHTGIEPDVKVTGERPDSDPFKAPDPKAKDEQLNRAIQVLRQEIRTHDAKVAHTPAR